MAMIPFGVGQFQNNDIVLGRTFLIGQLLTATTSIGLFFAVESMRTESGRFRTSDLARAEGMRDAQLITGISTVVFALIGIAEAQWHFNAETTLRERQLENPQVGEPKVGLGWTF